MTDQTARLTSLCNAFTNAIRFGAPIENSATKEYDTINQAIAAIPTLGLQQVAEFLNAMNVPPEVAIRTLVYPGRRRNF